MLLTYLSSETDPASVRYAAQGLPQLIPDGREAAKCFCTGGCEGPSSSVWML